MNRIRVLHISTAHQPYDPRIVYKQCQTLTERYEVICALPHADPTAAPAIRFVRLPYFRRLIWRVALTCPLVLLRCLWLRPHLVHVYVAEFLPFAYVFRFFGAKIIYEVQENLHKKMHLKTINKGYLFFQLFRWFDQLARRHFYLVFTEHGYLDTYAQLTKPHQVIYNYPLLPFLEPFRHLYKPEVREPVIFYIGWLSYERAFDVLIAALAQVSALYPSITVHLFGQATFTDRDLAQLPHYFAVKNNLRFHGYTDQRLAFPYAARATVGLALLKPVGDYPESYTTKLFEYMALGLPVITANFPLYQAIVETHRCGLCVACTNAEAIARALIYLIEHPLEARAMGQRGRATVERYYSWSSEAQKLHRYYERILN